MMSQIPPPQWATISIRFASDRRTNLSVMAHGLVCLMLIGCGIAQGDEHESEEVEPPITAEDRAHWSFQPLLTTDIPDAHRTDWCRNEIDTFIVQGLAAAGLRPQPSASKRILIHRLCFDLTGLPPTQPEIDAFVDDESESAYDALVARLLASPHYGERWALHWLDLARFAETDGFEHDKVRPDAWRYRDWVIDALNDDLPYDEFIRQQIAGDEIYPGDESARTATRFCLSGPDMPDINLSDERRHTVLNEIAATVGEVILGLQLGCAQCHDHKFDPISQADFYRFRANFEPAVSLKRNQSLSVMAEQFPYDQPSHLMRHGDFRSPGVELKPGVLRAIEFGQTSFAPVATSTSSGRRTALAGWITERNHPLTSRVIVNRLWQHHFGTGIVDTPSDFGVMGNAPTNQPLLDWLARYLVDHQWSIKALHRKIVTSSTYRQRSFLAPDASDAERRAWDRAVTADPNARMWSRYPRWRLEGESIRDSMLATAGQLNYRQQGPGVRAPLPPELVGTLLKDQWNVTEDPSQHVRRSVYIFARRNLRYPIFEIFDRPSGNASCPTRNVSTTAPQSLHLLNSRFSWQTSQQLSQAIRQVAADRDRQIETAYQQILGRRPQSAERLATEEFWERQTEIDSDPLAHLCLSLFNSNEFVFVD